MQFSSSDENDLPHLANTYSALIVLKILGDDYSRVRGNEILSTLN